MSDDRLPTATMAEYLRAEANLAATPTTALAGAVFAAGRAELLRQAADRLEELAAAVDAAIDLAVKYGGIDGQNHKAWVIDQMVRALAGDRYDAIARDAKAGNDGPDTYEWDEGTAP